MINRRFLFEIESLKFDLICNIGNTRAIFFFLMFRISKCTLYFPAPLKFIGFPIRIVYNIIIRYLLAMDVPLQTHIGHSCKIYHGFGMAFHPRAKVYKKCILRHGLTLGVSSAKKLHAPVISVNVDIGCNVVIIGEVSIGFNTVIGACSLIVKSVPSHSMIHSNLSHIAHAL